MNLKSVLFVTITLWTYSGCAPKPSLEWRSYGGEFTQTSVASLASAVKDGDGSMTEEVVVEGVIDEMCGNKGCWMVINDGETVLRVEFKDYGFFAPWGSEGKTARLQGTLKEKAVSRASAEHMASEMKNPPFRMDEIQETQTLLVFVASAMRIEGGSELSPEQKKVIEGKKAREKH